MNQLLEKEIIIENMIYEIRGKQVMLASDVAKLYQVETKRLNEVIKRNIERFPLEFCFQLTKDEIELLSSRSQFATLNKSDNLRGSNYKYLPYVLTEQGIMMLSGLLKSEIAVEMNIRIVKAFVAMKKYISSDLIMQNKMLVNHENRLLNIENTLDKLQEKEKINSIFFEGQIYDAYSLLIDIFNQSKNEIIIIDNYIDKNILDVLSKIDKKVIIITNKYNNDDYEKYKKQYHNITLKISNQFHDRFIIIDKSILYHSGASFKDLRNKCFALSKMEDSEILDKLLNNIK